MECVQTAAAYASSTSASTGSEAGPQTGTRAAKQRPQQVEKHAMGAMEDQRALEAKPGTVPVLMAEVRYGIVFGEMNEVFNGRLHRTLKFVGLLCAGLSATSLLQILTKAIGTEAIAIWAAVFAVLAVVCTALIAAYRFDKRESEFRAAKAAFQELESKGWGMRQDLLSKEINKIRKTAPVGGSWLASAAYNRACEELGHKEYHREMPGVVRVLAGLAS